MTKIYVINGLPPLKSLNLYEEANQKLMSQIYDYTQVLKNPS